MNKRETDNPHNADKKTFCYKKVTVLQRITVIACEKTPCRPHKSHTI